MLCRSKDYIEILNKKDTVIWTNLSDDLVDKNNKYQCVLYQCRNCGHIYQPIENDLRNVLNGIYLSNHAQASTAMGQGNWGMERAKIFLSAMNLGNYKTAVEIGCADGYLLSLLKSRGFKELVGIEPSLDKTKEKDGILFLKDFADEKLHLSKKYDLIFSAWVFEHIEDINAVIKFCRNNLSEDGCLFFSVPNAQKLLESGDPALFLHQHIHYFTEKSLMYLLSRNGFRINSLAHSDGNFSVNASIDKFNTETSFGITFYSDYQKKLEKVLTKVKNILGCQDIIVHGANHSLHNILTWIDGDFNFILVDNDVTKQGRFFSNKMVNSINDVDPSLHKTVLIIPNVFLEVIKTDYIKGGLSGEIESLMLS